MAPRTPKTLTFDDVEKAKQRKVVPVTITVDPNSDPPKVMVFKVGGIGRPGWESLIREHQPTDEQRDEHRAEQQAASVPPLLLTALRWNPDTFPPALIAAACVEPVMTVEQATSIWNDAKWSARECAQLFDAALEANDPSREALLASLGKGSTPTRRSGPK